MALAAYRREVVAANGHHLHCLPVGHAGRRARRHRAFDIAHDTSVPKIGPGLGVGEPDGCFLVERNGVGLTGPSDGRRHHCPGERATGPLLMPDGCPHPQVVVQDLTQRRKAQKSRPGSSRNLPSSMMAIRGCLFYRMATFCVGLTLTSSRSAESPCLTWSVHVENLHMRPRNARQAATCAKRLPTLVSKTPKKRASPKPRP